MDTLSAFFLASANQDKERRVFDWKKAAKYIKDNSVTNAVAGLSGDMEYTAGEILRNGEPVPKDETYTYLASNWATPVLEVDGDEIDCWSYQSEVPDYDTHTYWPEDALAILSI